jgi:enediyne biosynthesis protein E4
MQRDDESAVEKPLHRRKAKQRRRLVLALGCAGVLGWGGWAWLRVEQYHHALTEIRIDMAARRFAIAASKLEKLLAWKPNSDEAAYFLGVCELERGHSAAAAAAWANVKAGSAHSERAFVARMKLFYNSGQLSAAEQFIDEACRDPQNERTGVRVLLVPIFRELGRLEDAKRLIEARWEHFNAMGQGATEPAMKMVQLHIELTTKPDSVESVRAYLESASRQTPDDDRVWLGRANLALRAGAYDEATWLLDACQKRRPGDLPVWWARMHWGMATGQVAAVQESLKHLPVAEATPGQVHEIAAWLFFQRGDVVSERRELEHLIAVDPAKLTALDRLAQLAEIDGQPGRAAEFRSKRAEVQRLRTRYEKLYERKQPVRNAVEMARMAEQLGRAFEAQAFLTLAIAENPDRADLTRALERLMQGGLRAAPPGQSLADAVAYELASDRAAARAPSR